MEKMERKCNLMIICGIDFRKNFVYMTDEKYEIKITQITPE